MVSARAGFTLTEVIVSMTLLCVAGLGVAATGLVAIQTFTRAEITEQVLRDAGLLLDSLAALPSNEAGERAGPHARITWNAADSVSPLRLNVSLPGRAPIELTAER